MSDESKSIVDEVLLELGKVLLPIARINSPERVTSLLKNLGWELPNQDLYPSTFPDIEEMIFSLQSILDQIDSEQTSNEQFENFLALQECLKSLFDFIFNLKNYIENTLNDYSDFRDNSGILSEFHIRLVDYLFVLYLQTNRPRLYSILNILGIIERIEYDKNELSPYQPTFVLNKIHWNRFLLINDPLSLADKLYDWRTSFNSDLFLKRLHLILGAFSLPGGLYYQHPGVRNELGRQGEDTTELRVPFFQKGEWPSHYIEGGVNFAPVPAVAETNRGKGLAIIPYLRESAEFCIDISPKWEFIFKGSASLDSGIGFKLVPPNNVEIISDLFLSPDDSLDVQIEAKFILKNPNANERLVFGSPDTSRLSVEDVGFSVSGAKVGPDQLIEVEMKITNLRLVIKSDQGDSFLKKILPDGSINTTFDIGVGWSSLEGIYFCGSSALEVAIPVHNDLGPITIETVYLKIWIDRSIEITLATSFGSKIGPVSATVDQIGIKIPISFPDDKKGNWGPVQIDGVKFKPPTGAGFAIDAQIITGGGFLSFDTEKERYSGMLALQLANKIGMTAVGLITTKLPGNKEGFSLFVSIGITFDPAIQIYMGFTLSGVGGLIGINRTMKLDVLREGVKKGSLNVILFPNPKTVIANANEIISIMDSVFPPEEGKFVIGPMVQIGWGSPTVITGEIGIFLELFEPVRIVLMGQVDMAFPDKERTTMAIHIDILGTLDFEKKELAFQASIYGSCVRTFELSGDCALLLRWGNKPEMALAIGGFHPKFTPPPPPAVFSDLRRLGVSVNYGPLVRLGLKGYLALTPNSLQFGARVEIYVGVEAVDAGISGFLSFEALFNFSPFYFQVNMSGGLAISVMGFTLCDVRVTGSLAGPTPWNIRGNATVKVLFVDVDCGFNITWGPSDSTLLAAVDPWPKLRDALTNPANWSGRLPAGVEMVESFRPMTLSLNQEPTDTTDELPPVPVLVHPAGSLEVRQNVVPLRTTISRFGEAPICNYDHFRIEGIATTDGDPLAHETIDEYFSRGQFEALTPAKELSTPSFEKMPCGVTTGASHRIKFSSDSKSRPAGYESIMIKSDRTSRQADDPSAATAQWAQARSLPTGSAARRKGFAAYRQAPVAGKATAMVGVLRESYVVVDAATLAVSPLDSRVDVPAGGMTRTQADQALARHVKFHPKDAGRLLVVADYEKTEVA